MFDAFLAHPFPTCSWLGWTRDDFLDQQHVIPLFPSLSLTSIQTLSLALQTVNVSARNKMTTTKLYEARMNVASAWAPP